MVRGILTTGAIVWMLTLAVRIDHPLWIGLQATAWIAVALLIVLALPRWWLRGVFIICLAVLPLVTQWRTPPDTPEDAVRVVSINTQVERTDRTELITRITDLKPDIVILIETTDVEARAVADSTGLPVTGPIKGGGRGVAVLADLSDQQATATPELRASLHQLPVVDKHPVKVVGVHTAAPVNARLVEMWHEDFAELAAAAHSEKAVILAGDFNATNAHPPMKQLNLVDCAPGVPTWPTLAPFIGIDHILVKNATCGASGSFKVRGTDHLGVWADIIPRAV